LNIKLLIRAAIVFVGMVVCTGTFLYIQNNIIVISEIVYSSSRVPSQFNGYKILQISDLHNKQFGKNQCRLVKKIKDIDPDVIFITGDLVDSYYTQVAIALSLTDQITKIAPVYYIPGNHEARPGLYEKIYPALTKSGVHVLFNRAEYLHKGGQQLGIYGLADPTFEFEKSWGDTLKEFAARGKNSFDILLTHDPSYHKKYDNAMFDLVFAGHAHGGQIRLPFIGGLFATTQGWFPKYTSGLYNLENSAMIVSRGLGNSRFPLRLFNFPELVVVTLKTTKKIGADSNDI
jgi:predicted MPP superfamily phosphohydrolase